MHLKELSIEELRQRWAKAWGREPHPRLGQIMMVESLSYKMRERDGHAMKPEQQARLDQLVAEYKRNPKCFDSCMGVLKPGTRLIRVYEGKKYSVLVKADGFEYQGQIYSSLSKVANDITGSRWNGWLFFGLKK